MPQSITVTVAKEIAFDENADRFHIRCPARVKTKPCRPGVKPGVCTVRRIDGDSSCVKRVRCINGVEVVNEIRLDETTKFHRHAFATNNDPAYKIRRRIEVNSDARTSGFAEKVALKNLRSIALAGCREFFGIQHAKRRVIGTNPVASVLTKRVIGA